ncbi:phage portal protein [Massilia sp. P8910]|uniref:phage portal protein n=1 Tax=Massilia antarctica TaxID=2765360 RepID=UPI001E33DE50|nr:phage portal protein [Massilia antarctica]MCE3605754.1 phage portal protein [Massilia antarctica]
MSKNSSRRQRRGSDHATSVAFDPHAPQGERTQALAELQKAHMPTASDLAPMGHLTQFVEMAAEHLTMEKAINSAPVPFPSSAARSGKRGMQSVQTDEVMINMQGEYWERPSLMTCESMRVVVDQTPVLSALILTRMRQVQRFCAVAETDSDAPGFEIRHVDKEHSLTKSEKETIKQQTRFISNCGWEFKPRLRKALRRDSFSQFLAKATRDTLTMDACPIEVEWKRDKSLGIDGFYLVDGATIRLCTDKGYQGDPDVHALQVVQGRISSSYTFDDLIYEPRNPRSDVLACGYGHSEVELLVKVVTGYLNAMTYNIKGFDSNAIPKGMLNLVGNYSDADLAAFKRYWNSMVRGVQNQWTLPVMVAKDGDSKATFEKFGVEFNEMYFSKWMTFLTSLICAIYGISPSEINFDSFSGGNSSPLAGSDTQEKLTASKDSGLRPLLAYFQGLMTDYIIGDFSDSFVFRFTGLDPEDADKKHERSKLVMTVDEMRARDGMQAHKDKMVGAAPVNPALIQVYMQSIQPEPEPGEPEQEGDDATAIASGAGAKKLASGAAAADKNAPPPGSVGAEFDFGKAFNLPIYTMKDLMP